MYNPGQTFTMQRDEINNGITVTAAHTETLTIIEVLPKKSMFNIKDVPQTYKVTRHFKGDGIDTTNEVTLSERDIDHIIER